MITSPFSQVIIGFGNNKGQTKTRLLFEQTEKINRVNVNSIFGANPKITVKQISQINLAPFNQMIKRKRDQGMLSQLINSFSFDFNSENIQKIKSIAQKQYQDLAGELELLSNVKQTHENDNINKIKSKTGCLQKEAKKYYQKYKTVQKAVQMFNNHKKLIEKVSNEFQCNKQEAKSFLQANNYDMNVIH